MNDDTKQYLGDGVYASHDGYHVRLETMRGASLHVIYLEPAVLNALNRYAAGVAAETP